MGRQKASKPPSQAARRDPLLWVMIAGVLVLVLWTIYYFQSSLQNDWSIDRTALLAITPDLLLSNVFSSPEESLPSGWRYFPQRFDLIATASFIIIGAWGLGSLLLRAVKLARGQFDNIERTVLALGLGLSAWSLFTLASGLSGWLSRPLFSAVLLAVMVAEVILLIREVRLKRAKPAEGSQPPGFGLITTCLLVTVPFLLATALGAMLPPVDFDVKEYHLGGPKEWFLEGQMYFLPHNVYTSFPFLTEMLSLSAMVVHGDWYRGALAGQLVLATFLPITAITVFAIGRRLFGATAGLLGAVVYVTTPWTYRIAVIAYAEGGLTCYLALALLAAVIAIQRLQAGDSALRIVFIAGLFAGSGMACKYPGVIQVVIPIGAALIVTCLWRSRRSSPATAGAASQVGSTTNARDTLAPDILSSGERNLLRSVAMAGVIYAFGVLLAVGPWLIKNAVETGNPVYPLLWSVFGGQDWDAALNAKWRAAHSPSNFQFTSLISDVTDAAVRSNWQSLLVFGFAPFALLRRRVKAAAALWAYMLYLLAAWWLLTHRIDRFWLPLLPAAAVLAGAGATWIEERTRSMSVSEPVARTSVLIWRVTAVVFFAIAIPFNLAVVTSGLSGPPNYLADLDAAAKVVATPNLAILNDMLPPGAKVLLVGEAEIFDARFPVVYNTVFDRNIFQQWTADPQPGGIPEEDWPLRTTEEIRQVFTKHGITHLYVNWREIIRYRTTYGFTPFVTPERFHELRQRAVLGDAVTLRRTPLEAIGDAAQRREIETRFEPLIEGRGENAMFVAAELYPVTVE